MEMKNPHAIDAGASDVLGRNSEASTSNQHNPQPTEVAYAAFKRADATWELHRWAPENLGNDLPEELENRLCEEHESALVAYLLTSAEDLWALYRKLRTFHHEDVSDRSGEVREKIIQALIDDVHRLASEAQRQALAGVRA